MNAQSPVHRVLARTLVATTFWTSCWAVTPGLAQEVESDYEYEGALHVPFSVYDTAGTIVGEGTVGGEPLELAQGFYRVVVQTSPPKTFDKVEVPGEKKVELEVK